MAATISVMRLNANGCDYCIPSDTNRTSWYEWYALVSWYTNLPPFLPPLSPTTPITPYNPPNSPLKQINCLRPPRQNGTTTATTESNNQMFFEGSFPLQPSIFKSYTVSQQVRPLPSSAVRFYWLNMGIPSIWPLRYVTFYRPAHRADRVTSNGNGIYPEKDSGIWPVTSYDYFTWRIDFIL